MKNKIKANYLFGIPKVSLKGDLCDNLILLGCIMETTSKRIMLKQGCSYEDALKFVQDLPNKLVYDEMKHDITIIKEQRN